MGGTVPNPTYEQVCTDKTSHAETVAVTYDVRQLTHQELLREFFTLHDITKDRRQSSDGQYRSAIFPDYDSLYGAEQYTVAEQMIERLEANGIPVSTELATENHTFYPAANRHQQYCSVRGIRPKRYAGDRIREVLTF